MIPILFATTNHGKIKEFKELLKIATRDFSGVTYQDIEVEPVEVEEPHQTFWENALEKAIQIAKQTDYSVLADDSGLVVPALGGAPGVYSARFAEKQQNIKIEKKYRDQENNKELLGCLKEVKDRAAYFASAIAIAIQKDDFIDMVGAQNYDLVEISHGQLKGRNQFFRIDDLVVAVVEGRCEGEIVTNPCGSEGFGYDPIFQPTGFNCTMAQLTLKEKNQLSHRRKAMEALGQFLESSWKKYEC